MTAPAGPVFPAGPPSWPPPDAAVWAMLERAYASGDWGAYQGEFVNQLERQLAALHGVEFAYACCSGTVAVELALRGARVQPGDEVILAGYDFPGNFRAIEAVGAFPVLADIDPATWCLDVDRAAAAFSPATRAIIVSHLHGGVANMPAFRQLVDNRNCALIEDACQSPGATVFGRVAGSWGDVGVLSFGGSKLLTSGRGGALVTASGEMHQRVKAFCERGNHAFPLSELQAAVLLPQLTRLAERHAVRLVNVQQLRGHARRWPALRCVAEPPAGCSPAFYKLAFDYSPELAGGISRANFAAAVEAEGVALGEGFRGFAKRPTSVCRHADALIHSRRAAERTLLLHHPVLLESPATIDRVALAFEKVLHF